MSDYTLPAASAETQARTRAAREAAEAKRAELQAVEAKQAALAADLEEARQRRAEGIESGAAAIADAPGPLARLAGAAKTALGLAKPPGDLQSIEIGERGLELLDARAARLRVELASLEDAARLAEARELRERGVRLGATLTDDIRRLGAGWRVFLDLRETLRGDVDGRRVPPLPVLAVSDSEAARILQELGAEVRWANSNGVVLQSAREEYAAVEVGR